MKTTIIPAQITTVEDRIVGTFTFVQLFLLFFAFVLDCLLYLVFPPIMSLALYKIPIIVVSTLVCSLLSLRIKGRIILQWFVIIFRYCYRPQYFIADKNELVFRLPIATQTIMKKKVHAIKKGSKNSDVSGFHHPAQLERLLIDPRSKVRITFAKKGGIHVSVS